MAVLDSRAENFLPQLKNLVEIIFVDLLLVVEETELGGKVSVNQRGKIICVFGDGKIVNVTIFYRNVSGEVGNQFFAR